MMLELKFKNPNRLAELFFAIASDKAGAWRGVGIFNLIQEIFDCTREEAEILYSHGLRLMVGQPSDVKLIIHSSCELEPVESEKKPQKKKG